jgi:hypothetical protein
MEVTSKEADGLKKILAEWMTHPEQELEATCGGKGGVSITSFHDIMQRIRNKGFQPLAQEDRLNILLPNTIRFTLSGLGQIQQYCRDNILTGRPFTAMRKDRVGVESTIDFREYDVRVKARREIPIDEEDDILKPILSNWANEKKAFRLIHRWSFIGHGVRFDLSAVRSSPQDKTGKFVYIKNFGDYNFLAARPKYEVEVELVRDEIKDTAEAMKTLIRSVGEVLRGFQRNTILIRKSIREDALASYKALVSADRFRGVAPVTLMMRNMEEAIDPKMPNIRTGYNVTDKADGLRVHAYTNQAGELFLIDMGLNVYRTGLRSSVLKSSLLDGEWVTRDRDGKPVNMLLLFDMYYDREGKNVTKLPFKDAAGQGRYAQLEAWVRKFNEGEGPEIVASGVNVANQLNVSMKTFYFGRADDRSIFGAAAQMLSMPQVYHTDGLIFTPNAAPLPQKPGETFAAQFKWKPAEENTIDFLVNYEKNPEIISQDKVVIGIEGESGESLRYKVLRLYVGSSRDPAFSDPRATILNDKALPAPENGGRQEGAAVVRNEYRPVLFNPIDPADTMANICYGRIEVNLETGDESIVTEDGEPIADRSIVEMRYDPSKEPGWRWIPMRIRHDKTERLNKGIYMRTLNAEKTANSVWESIHDPITESMIRTGSEVPLDSEIAAIVESRAEQIGKKYYDKKASKTDMLRIEGLRAFHNRWIKDHILLESVLREGGRTLVDFACGKGGDMQKWIKMNPDFVLGIDIAGDGIRDPHSGAYRRYMDALMYKGVENVPPMAFAIADVSKPLVDGSAGATPEESDILRSVFKKYPAEGALPPYITRVAAGALRTGANVGTCMFALHYFFESGDKLDGFLKNLSDIIPVDGYFIGCAFDGDKVFDTLAGIPMGGKKQGADGDTSVWTITKQYPQNELPDTDAAFGMPIDVEFLSIGSTHREYLIPFKLLVKKMRTIGFEIISDDEAKSKGLVQGTGLFEVSYKMAAAAGRKFPMSDSIKEFSFLNRWYIFKRTSEEPIVIDDAVREMMQDAATKAAEAAGKIQKREAARAALETLAKMPQTTEAVSAKQKAQAAAELLARVKPEISAAASERAGSPEVIVRTQLRTAEGDGAAAAAAAAAATPMQALRPVKAAAAPEEEGEEGAAAPAAAAAAAAPKGKRTYELSEIFQFYIDAPEIQSKQQDPLGVQKVDRYAASRLATIFPSRIEDVQEDGSIVVYPSVEHYVAAMMIKRCAGNAAIAKALFFEEGYIHNDFISKRRTKKITEKTFKQYQESLKEEYKAIQDALKPDELRKYRITGFTVSACTEVMLEAYREGYRQRMERDETFRAIMARASEKQLYLLNFDPAGTDLSGRRLKSDKTIKGNNKIGKILMDLAGIPYNG